MAVFIKKVNIPQKSDLINIDMTGSGTAQTYRVIKNVGGSVVEVMSMSDSLTSAFGTNNTYENGTADVYLNSTWYNTLSNDAKVAIVDKTFTQDSWYWGTSGNPDYQGKYSGDTAYRLSLGNASFGNEITRHAYAISVQDVLDYLEVTPQMTQADTTLTYDNVWTMFWNSTTTHSGNIWLRSAYASDASYAFYVYGTYGILNRDVDYSNYAVRPAFQIDLSKIDYTFADGRSLVELKPVSILQKSNNALSRVELSYKVSRVTDLIGTTWQFNDDITSSPLASTQSISGTMYFTREGHSDQSSQVVYDITYNARGYADYIIFDSNAQRDYPYVQYYPSNGWQLREGRDVRTNITTPTISITSGTADATNTILINWFYANATRIS